MMVNQDERMRMVFDVLNEICEFIGFRPIESDEIIEHTLEELRSFIREKKKKS